MDHDGLLRDLHAFIERFGSLNRRIMVNQHLFETSAPGDLDIADPDELRVILEQMIQTNRLLLEQQLETFLMLTTVANHLIERDALLGDSAAAPGDD